MSKTKNKKSTMITLRIPNFILNDLKYVQNFLNYSSLSSFIISVMSAEILKYYKVINYENV